MSQRAWIQVVPDEEATGKVKEVYKKAETIHGGNINITRVASLWPELLDVQEREFELFSRSQTELGDDIKELIAAHVSRLNNCEYYEKRYRDALVARGWSDEKITHILQDIHSDHLDEKSRAILIFADKITRKPQSMSYDDIEKLRQAGIEDRAILEAATISGYYNHMTRLANSLGVVADS